MAEKKDLTPKEGAIGCAVLVGVSLMLFGWCSSRNEDTANDGRQPGVIPSQYAPPAPMPVPPAASAAASDDSSLGSIGDQAPTEEPTAAPAPRAERDMFLEITSKKLLAAYKDNAIKADANYKLRYAQVSGKVAEVGKDLANNAPFVKVGSGGAYEFEHVTCYLRPDEVAEAAQLSKGKPVKVRGKVAGYLVGDVLLGDCSVD
jgi:hypothetical protein